MEIDKLCLDSTNKIETIGLVQTTGLFPRTKMKKYVLLCQGTGLYKKKKVIKWFVRDENERRLKYVIKSEESEAMTALASTCCKRSSSA